MTTTQLNPAKIMQRDEWVRETQMFQRIAKVPETPAFELEAEWESMRLRDRRANSDSLRVSRAIQQAALGQNAVPDARPGAPEVRGKKASVEILGLEGVVQAAESLKLLAEQIMAGLYEGSAASQRRALEDRVALMRGALNYVVPLNKLETVRMSNMSRRHANDLAGREFNSYSSYRR